MEQKILLNRYKVLEKLGEGGMATVWKVYDEVEEKEVALKVIKKKPDEEKLETGSRLTLTPTKTGSSEAELGFSEEFRTMTKLQYPYTVKVFDYGVLENGDKYITMEIVKGENLREILKERKLNFQEIYKILIQLTQTLSFIHSRLYVHRDIKSNNIIITKDGNVKLMDFGLMDRIGVTSDGTMTGTVQYMPPEVFKSGIINESSDLYSLGILGYELVTGNPPFQGREVMDIVRMHMKASLKPLMELRPDTPPEFERIVFKLLEKEQSNRYQTASEVIEDLSKLIEEKITIETLEQKKSYLYCSKLIGREKETEQLRNAFEEMRKGKGQIIFIGAPAGIGKSRLLQEFKLEIQLADVPFLEGFCVEQGMSVYQPLREAFRPILPMTKKEIIDKYGSVLVKIFPELRRKGYEPASPLDEIGEKVRLFENVIGWLREVSKIKPIVICIEDLHWADLSSIDLLNACFREVGDLPVMFLAAFRDDEVEETSPILYTIEEGITQLMKLTPLNQDDVSTLIKEMLGRVELADDFSKQVFSITGGNPFFVSETMRTLIEGEQIRLEHGRWIVPEDISRLEFPTTVEATITRRLKLISQEAYNLTQVASVIGREVDLSLLKEISNLDDDKLFQVLDELVERQFIKREAKKYVFTHDRVRETLYDQLNENEIKKLHEKVGNILEARNVDNIDAVVDILAHHFSRGINNQKAIRYLILAGDQSFRNYAMVKSIQAYKQAIQILEEIDYPEKEWVLLQTWEKLIQISLNIFPRICLEACEAMLVSLYKLGGGVNKLLMITKLIRLLYKLINLLPKEIAEKIKDKLDEIHPLPPPPKTKFEKLKMKLFPDFNYIIPRIIFNHGYSSWALYFLGKYSESISVINDCIKKYLPEQNSLIEAMLTVGKQNAIVAMGKSTSIIKEVKNAISIFEKYCSKFTREQWLVYGGAYFHLNDSLAFMGKINEEYYQKGLKIYEEHNLIEQIGWILYIKSSVEVLKGEHQEFVTIVEKASDISKIIGKPYELEFMLNLYRAFDLLQRGEFDLAQRYIRKANSLLQKHGVFDSFESGYLQMLTGRMLLGQGKMEQAFSQMQDAISLCREKNLGIFSLALADLAEIYINLGDLKEAAPLAKEAHQRAISQEYENPYHQMISYRILGCLSLKQKKFEESRRYFDESLKITQKDDNPIQEGLTQLALAKLFNELTQYTSTKESLEKAAAKFKEINNPYQLKEVQALQNKLKEVI